VKRVMVVGGPGSGKSTLAVKLGEITGLPVFHMDKIHYKSGWKMRSRDEKFRLATEIEAQKSWIFEGGLSATYANRAARADTVIWLDLPLPLRLARILKRRVQFNGKTRPDMADGCPERLKADYMRWVLTATPDMRKKIAQAIADAPHLKVHHIHTAKGADTWLKWLRDDNKNNN